MKKIFYIHNFSFFLKTHKQPVTEYEAIREKAANQKRDIERALTKFLAKTSETESLFDTEDNMFPCKFSFFFQMEQYLVVNNISVIEVE